MANALRTGMHAHRPLPADTEPAQAIAVLAVPGKTPSGTSVGLCSGQQAP